MPLESASYISGLVATNPPHSDPLDQIDSHIRLLKQVLLSTFPNFSAAMNSSAADLDAAVAAVKAVDINATSGTITLNGTAPDLLIGVQSVSGHLVPSGGIILWSGASTNVPPGWFICNGLNGTPNLLDRFVIGAGSDYSAGVSGGASSQSITTSSSGSHNHTGASGAAGAFTTTGTTDAQGAHSHTGNTGSTAITIDQMPSHNHTFSLASTNSGSGSGIASSPSTGTTQYGDTSTGGGQGHTHAISSDGAHQHNVAIGGPDHTHSIASDGTHSHTATVSTLPPYYALCYIMKS